jgi:hypothetical protein
VGRGRSQRRKHRGEKDDMMRYKNRASRWDPHFVRVVVLIVTEKDSFGSRRGELGGAVVFLNVHNGLTAKG